VYYLRPELCSALFLWAKGLSAKDIINKCFLFTVGSVYRVKRFSLGGKHFADDEEVETEVPMWLTQKLKDFYAAGFDALVNRWGGCINVCG
jgi:hypothetical protein